MSLRFDPSCQALIDVAKKALPDGSDGSELDIGTLLGALYYGGNFHPKYPRLGGFLPRPIGRRRELPGKVSLVPEVRPVFQAFAERGTPVEAEELFLVLLHSAAGRRFMAGQAAPGSSPSALVAGQPPAQANWRSSPERLSAIHALSSYGRMLTTTEINHGQVVEREEALKAVVRTLSKMKRRNVILIGLPGTGKSALIYELSRRIYRSDASLPARLRDMDVFELSPVFLRAGATMMGQLLPRAAELTEAEVYSRLSGKIIGQEAALREIAKGFVAGLGKWSRRSGPRGVFLFAGPTGVGKTETALLLSRILGGDRENLVRVDCNTLQGTFHESGQALNRLLGVPPGYLGYARAQGDLLSRIRDFPQSVVLFDECEKAGLVLGRLLLQIIDEGKVEDVDGNILDFRRAYIVFTTNAGCTNERSPMGFNPQEQQRLDTPAADLDAVKRELRVAGMGEEFFGRIMHSILFRGLDRQSLRTILNNQLEGLRLTSETRGLMLVWSEDLVSHVAAEWQPRFGVRCATTMLRHRISEQLDLAETQGELKGIRQIRLEVLSQPYKAAERALAGFAARRLAGDTLIISVA